MRLLSINLTVECFFYGKFYTCNKDSSGIVSLTGLAVFLISKLFFIIVVIKIKIIEFLKKYSWPFLGVFVMMDLAYVLLYFLPLKLDLDFYYHSSFLVRPSIAFSCKNWIVFGVSGLFYVMYFSIHDPILLEKIRILFFVYFDLFFLSVISYLHSLWKAILC